MQKRSTKPQLKPFKIKPKKVTGTVVFGGKKIKIGPQAVPSRSPSYGKRSAVLELTKAAKRKVFADVLCAQYAR